MIFRVLLTLVLLAPLPLASVHAWAWGLITTNKNGIKKGHAV